MSENESRYGTTNTLTGFPSDPAAPTPIRGPAGADWRETRLTPLQEELRAVINRHSAERASDTPDFLLAQFISACLDAYANAVKARDQWFQFNPWPGG